MSAGWRQGPDHVPSELHYRPGYFVRYMQDVQLKAADMTPSMVRVVDASAGKYSVQSSSGPRVYAVDFGHDTGRPSCTCYEFARRHLPCKHFATVFLYQQLSFSSLPASYTQHPMLTGDPAYMGNHAAGVQQQEEQFAAPSDDVPPPLPARDEDVEASAEPDDDTELGRAARSFREVLADLNSLTYLSQSALVLDEVCKLLVNMRNLVARSCPADVMHLLPDVKKKRRQFTSPELPPRKRRRAEMKQTTADDECSGSPSAVDVGVESTSVPAESAQQAPQPPRKRRRFRTVADEVESASPAAVADTGDVSSCVEAAKQQPRVACTSQAKNKKKVTFAAHAKVSDFFEPAGARTERSQPVSTSQPQSAFHKLASLPELLLRPTVRSVTACFPAERSSCTSGINVSLSKADMLTVVKGHWMMDNVSTSCTEIVSVYSKC